MAPIRVGIIGLSKGWAANAHLPYLKRSEHYQIVAVQNSSVESAKRAIETLELGEGVKAYGDSEDIAADENVDLVVCSVRVDRHNSTISPSLRKGKNVFVEWPLGKSLADAEELLKLKNESGVKNDFVGLQARQDPIINTLKHLLATNAIGDVLSSTWTCYASQGGPTTIETIEYLGRKEVGGNLVTIHLGHAIDFIQHAFGSYFKTNPNENDISSLLATRRPFITLLSNDGKTVLSDHHPKTSDDTIFVQGTLPGTLPEKQIPISITLLGGPAPTFSGIPGLDWRIHGTKGNLRITASGPFLQIGYPDSKIERQDLESGEVEVVEVKTAEGEEKWIEELPMPARNVGRIYEGIKEVLRGGDSGAPPGYGEGLLCTFEDAVERHRILERL